MGSVELGQGEIDLLSCSKASASPEEAEEAIQMVDAPLDPHHPRSTRRHCLPKCTCTRVDEGHQQEYPFISHSRSIQFLVIRRCPRMSITIHAGRPVEPFRLPLFHLSPDSVKRDRQCQRHKRDPVLWAACHPRVDEHNWTDCAFKWWMGQGFECLHLVWGIMLWFRLGHFTVGLFLARYNHLQKLIFV